MTNNENSVQYSVDGIPTEHSADNKSGELRENKIIYDECSGWIGRIFLEESVRDAWESKLRQYFETKPQGKPERYPHDNDRLQQIAEDLREILSGNRLFETCKICVLVQQMSDASNGAYSATKMLWCKDDTGDSCSILRFSLANLKFGVTILRSAMF
ncbi:MAG: hypothetical protein MHMPM18_001565 [Marteilia pararefringens]